MSKGMTLRVCITLGEAVLGAQVLWVGLGVGALTLHITLDTAE